MFDRTGKDRDRHAAMKSATRPNTRRRLDIESLEGRQLLTASLGDIANVNVPTLMGRTVPLDGSGTTNNQSFTVTSDNPSIKVTPSTGKFLTINVSHTSSGTGDIDVNGSMTFQLFDDLTPLTASRIEQLVNSGFYSGKNIHRIASGFPTSSDFIVQGGSVNGDGTGNVSQTGFPFRDEFVTQLAFTGTGQLAMANSGSDTNSSQFFITTGSPRFLDYKHNVFGQIVDGQDILQKLTQIKKGSDGTTPASTVTITSAALSDNSPNGVLYIDTATAAANTTANVTVTAKDATDNTTASKTFKVTVIPLDPTNNERPFLQPVDNITVGKGQTARFKITGVDIENNTLTYTVKGGVSNGAFTNVSNATATVDSNGVVTVAPTAGFSGTINLLVGVRDQTNRAGTTSIDDPSNFQTHTLTVTVNSSDTVVDLKPIALDQATTITNESAKTIQLSATPAATSSTQALTYSIVTQPTNGTITAIDASTGKVTYTPKAGYTGPDFFTYNVSGTGEVSKGSVLSNTATVELTVTQAVTGAVRFIQDPGANTGTLVVTPPPRTDGGTNTVVVDQVNSKIQVTVNGVIDQNQPTTANVNRVVVFGTKANDEISINSNVTVPVTLDGGRGGKNSLKAGGGAARLHGWYGQNTLQGGSGNDALLGRKGQAKFLRSGGTDLLYLGEPGKVRVKNHGVKRRLIQLPPSGTYYKFVGTTGNKIRPVTEADRAPKTTVNQVVKQATAVKKA